MELDLVVVSPTAASAAVTSKEAGALFNLIEVKQDLSFVEKVLLSKSQIFQLFNKLAHSDGGSAMVSRHEPFGGCVLETVGFYESKGLMVDIFAREKAFVEEDIAKLRSDQLPAGLYGALHGRKLLIFYWQPSKKFTDARRSDISCNFLRYLVELCDVVYSCIELENAGPSMASIGTSSSKRKRTQRLQVSMIDYTEMKDEDCILFCESAMPDVGQELCKALATLDEKIGASASEFSSIEELSNIKKEEVLSVFASLSAYLRLVCPWEEKLLADGENRACTSSLDFIKYHEGWNGQSIKADGKALSEMGTKLLEVLAADKKKKVFIGSKVAVEGYDGSFVIARESKRFHSVDHPAGDHFRQWPDFCAEQLGLALQKKVQLAASLTDERGVQQEARLDDTCELMKTVTLSDIRVSQLEAQVVLFGSQTHLLILDENNVLQSVVLDVTLASQTCQICLRDKLGSAEETAKLSSSCYELDYLYHIFNKYAVSLPLLRASPRCITFRMLINGSHNGIDAEVVKHPKMALDNLR
ncbi:hypothetical protein SELMODRAFT_408447 [Selaginella moellendorffii]|uniref:Uncharacterized protein n=1 Tax=Selaginella moellendorffii TaxID=88036 RepID=D8R8B5_SELML|nr:hypothetical protein SELMODRAFT_408447 [Selaginella moellendorffii]